MRIYIACGLTHVPRGEFTDYVALVHGLAAHLTSVHGHDVRYALRDSDPQLASKPFSERARLCYLWDREMVEWAEVVVAEASYPSTGLGIELQIACARETPIVIAFRLSESRRAQPVKYQGPDKTVHELQLGERYVSLMALGLPSVFRIQPYYDADDVCRAIVESIGLLVRPPGTQ